jgi:hypothetical protein
VGHTQVFFNIGGDIGNDIRGLLGLLGIQDVLVIDRFSSFDRRNDVVKPKALSL